MTLPSDIPLGALISLLHRSHSNVLNARLKPLGLSAGQFPILLVLSRREGISQDTLARYFSLDKATIARALRRLEEDGFLCRRTVPGNR
jgi:DNA-binding MarR family transcriptional regulator